MNLTLPPERLCSVLLSFLVRSLPGNYEVRVPESPEPGFGTLVGVPVLRLGCTELRRTPDTIAVVAGGEWIERTSCDPCLLPALYNGTADDLISEANSKSTISDKAGYADDPALFDAFSRARDLLSEVGASWRWVSSAIASVSVTPPNPEHFRTGSWSGQPGTVHISRTTDFIRIAEALLHEACHQTFYFANLDEGLADDDGELRWSPPVKSFRPIWALLLAYHAFANACILLARCIDAGYRADEHLEPNLRFAKELEETLAVVQFQNALARDMFQRLRGVFHQSVR